MPDWLTAEHVAEYHDAPEDDDRLIAATAAVKSAVERRRADLDFEAVPDDVLLGAVMWAGIIYQARNAPSGFAGYGDETQMFAALGERQEVFKLLGFRRPVTG